MKIELVENAKIGRLCDCENADCNHVRERRRCFKGGDFVVRMFGIKTTLCASCLHVALKEGNQDVETKDRRAGSGSRA